MGSTFSFTVRLERATVSASAHLAIDLCPQVAEPQRVGSKKRCLQILLAEDNIVNQRVVAELIRREGHDLVIVENGREAVAAVKEKAFDLVLMDIQMPVMDGFEATEAIREAEKDAVRHTPIVAMTAHAMIGDQEKCIQARMDDYLSKPINFASLLAMLDKWTQNGLCSESQPLAKSITSVTFDGAAVRPHSST